MGLEELASSREKITYLFGEAPLPPQGTEPPDIKIFSLMQNHVQEGGQVSWFTFVYPDVAALCKDAPPEKKGEIVNEAYEFFQTLMSYNNPRFAVHTFGYLYAQKSPDDKAPKVVCDQAYLLYNIIDGYNQPVFAKNFFPYLFERSQRINPENRERLVYTAIRLVIGIMFAFVDRFEGEEFLRRGTSLKPETSFAELEFMEKDYAAVKKRMAPDADLHGLPEFEGNRTIAGAIGSILCHQGLAPKEG